MAPILVNLHLGIIAGSAAFLCESLREWTMRRLIPFMALAGFALAACGHNVEQRAATGAIAGAVVAGPVGAAVGAGIGAAVSKTTD